MAPDARQFTLTQLARALGVDRTSVRDALRGIPATGETKVCGQTTWTWTLGALPAKMRQRLDGQNVMPDGTLRYRTTGDMIAGTRPIMRTPKLSELDPDGQWLTRCKMDILAPLLRRHVRGGKGNELAQLAREARPRFMHEEHELRAMQGREARPQWPSERTIEEWLRTALERDDHRHKFDEPDRYTCSASRRQVTAAGDTIQFPAMEIILSSGDGPALAKESGRLWQAAFMDYDRLLAAGLPAAKIRRAAIARLGGPGSPYADTKPASIAVAWTRKMKRWTKEKHLPSALNDRRKFGVGLQDGNGGTPKYKLTRDECLCLRLHNLERGSLALAVEWFVKDVRCLPGTRALILAELDRSRSARRIAHWPVSIRRAGYVTAEERALYLGPKAMQNLEMCSRRGNFYEVHGVSHELQAGTCYESDDMSGNEPCKFTDPETGIIRLGRQTLITNDVFSAAFLGVTPIGRERDAYRVEDIADHMADIIDAHGIPVAWRLERGTWENSFIDGFKLPDGSRWGGLDEIFAIIRAYTSRGKGGIESSFNLLQSMTAHLSVCIGRNRGEFEKATRLVQAAQRASAQAQKLRTQESIDTAIQAHTLFWEMADMTDGYAEAMRQFNLRPKMRRAHGKQTVVPDELFRGAVRRDCPAGDRWRLLPVKRPASVRRGVIEMSVDHYPMSFRFTAAGVVDGLHLENGYSVLVAFHPGKPELGCHVFNAETGPINRDGIRFAAKLLVAPIAPDSPQFTIGRADQDAFAGRRKASAAVRTEFHAIVPAGRSGARVTVARDGRGNSFTRNADSSSAKERPRPKGNPEAEALYARTEEQRRREECWQIACFDIGVENRLPGSDRSPKIDWPNLELASEFLRKDAEGRLVILKPFGSGTQTYSLPESVERMFENAGIFIQEEASASDLKGDAGTIAADTTRPAGLNFTVEP